MQHPRPETRPQMDKWSGFYTHNFLPWDSRRPASQLVTHLTSCIPADQPLVAPANMQLPPQHTAHSAAGLPVHACGRCVRLKPPAGASVLEIGSGTGVSSIFMASKGYRVVGVDLVPAAVAAARVAAQQAGMQGNCAFVQHDVFALPAEFSFDAAQRLQTQQQQQQCHEEVHAGSTSTKIGRQDDHTDAPAAASAHLSDPSTTAGAAQAPGHTQPFLAPPLHGHFDMVYDCQTFHVLREVDPTACARALAQLLRPGGVLFLLTGNAEEPYVGPNVLSQEELRAALPEEWFELAWLRRSRFDDTHHYTHVLKQRPLAWWAVFVRQ